MAGPGEQPPEPLGPLAVKAAPAERSALERPREIGVEGGDRPWEKIRDDAPALGEQLVGPAVDVVVEARKPSRSRHSSKIS
jgi:hypothetical protein